MTTTHHLAQLNISRWIRPAGAPENIDFHAALDRINALAEAQPGFVWRLTGDGNNATDIVAYDDPQIIVNLTVWQDMEHLAAFAYRTAHRDIMRRRDEWFEPRENALVLWWVQIGHIPTVAEAKARLAYLETYGPTAAAFTFRRPFPAPGTGGTAAPMLETCD